MNCSFNQSRNFNVFFLSTQGCTGAVAYEFTKVHPAMSVTVFDLPAVVEMSELFRPETADNRVSFVAGQLICFDSSDTTTMHL